MSQWLAVCTVDDLQADSGICALVNGQQIAVFYVTRSQQVYATANFDPVGKANVLSRSMIGDLAGEPMLAAPLYKQHYSLITGQCLENPALSIATYPVRIDQQQVWIQL